MSNKLDFITYTRSLLQNASSKQSNAAIAGRLDAIARSAENISDGYWTRLAPLYEPFSPTLQLGVKNLNDGIIAGQNVPNFDAYISTLVSNLAL